MNGLSVPLFGEHAQARPDVPRFGEKGAYLHWLAAKSECVPAGFVIEPRVVLDIQAGKLEVLSASLRRLLHTLEPSEALAVRASPAMALPGALKTVLDVALSPDHDGTLASVVRAISSVVASASTPTFIEQLEAHGLTLPEEPWLAVIVQRMIRVHDSSGFGLVAHSRSPLSGKAGLVGEYVRGHGAPAVVGGQARPRPLLRYDAPRARPDECLEAEEPGLVEHLRALLERLERELKHPVEIEAVYDGASLWLVEARPAVLSVRGFVRAALDALDQGVFPAHVLSELSRKKSGELSESQLPQPAIVGEASVIARGLAASPGVSSGALCIDAARILSAPKEAKLVLVRRDAVPEDVALFRRASALVTTSGGLTSHAAVIARGLSLPAIVGTSELFIDEPSKTVRSSTRRNEPLLREGDVVTVDAHRGILYRGALTAEPVITSPELRELLSKTAEKRPCALWTLGSARAALRARDDCQLSGAVVRFEPQLGSLPEATGYVLVQPDMLELALRSLPHAGLCLAHARTVDLRTLRDRFPARPLGVMLGPDDPALEGVPIDLAIVSDGYPHGASLSAEVRLRLVDEFGKDGSKSGHSLSDGLICAPEHAAKWALGLLIST